MGKPELKQIAIRVPAKDLALLEKVAAKCPNLSKSVVLRAALKIGLDALNQDPSKVVTT